MAAPSHDASIATNSAGAAPVSRTTAPTAMNVLRMGYLQRRLSVGLSYHAGEAAGLAARRLDLALEVAARLRALIAGPHIGPGPALGFTLANLLAGLAARI